MVTKMQVILNKKITYLLYLGKIYKILIFKKEIF